MPYEKTLVFIIFKACSCWSAYTETVYEYFFRKRAAARQLIENYYYQLTDGCGNPDCDNKCCASCPDFPFKSVDRNELALQAVQLSRSRARLCEGIPQKYAKYPVQESSDESTVTCHDGAGASTSSHSGTTSGPDLGTRVSSGGAKSKLPSPCVNQAPSASSSASSQGSKPGL